MSIFNHQQKNKNKKIPYQGWQMHNSSDRWISHVTNHCYSPTVFVEEGNRGGCWKTSLSFYPLHSTNATRICCLLWLLWRGSMGKKWCVSHDRRTLRDCLWPCGVNRVQYASGMFVGVNIFEDFHSCLVQPHTRVFVCVRAPRWRRLLWREHVCGWAVTQEAGWRTD